MNRQRDRRLLIATAAAAVAVAGVVVSASAEGTSGIRRILPLAAVEELQVLDPVLALPRTTLVIAAARAEHLLEGGRPWAAWQEIRPFIDGEHMTPGTALLAARAAAGWGGWREVRTLLRGQAWLDETIDGEGWRLLAAAEEGLGSWREAAVAHARHAASIEGSGRGVALARRAVALSRVEDFETAAAAFREAAASAELIGDWLAIREMEALTRAGRLAPSRVPAAAPTGSPVARARWASVGASALLAAGDSAAAIDRLEREMRLLIQRRAMVEAGGLMLEWSSLVAREARSYDARDQLRALAWEASLPASLRMRAADRLRELAVTPTPAEELARAAAYEAGGRPGQAARSLRVAISAGLVDDAATRLRLGRLLFDAGDNRPAREVLLEAAAGLSGEDLAEAELLAARARFRAGDRTGGMADIRRVTETRSGTAAAGTALFILADAATTMEQALPLYRRAGATEAPEAREALHRVGDRRLRLRDSRGAADAWAEYVRRFPSGSETARVAYSAGLLNDRLGRSDAARQMFVAAVAADPLSYYAVRAGERVRRDPLSDVLGDPSPWLGLTSDPTDARTTLERLDLLAEAGLDSEWRDELDSAIRRFDERPLALVTLAEGLRDRGRIQDAVRLARRIVEKRGGQWDGRLLRVAFPLPYRGLLEAESERYGIDPMLFAGLIRQESMFQAAVRSRVGATGLSQIMPATGRWIAPRVGVPADQFTEQVLTVPEVNLRMGALYLGDLMRRYDGAIDLALAGYNAGPGRADRWRRELGHERDVDAFRDAIPFDETRHYVKIVLRNAWVYQRLYSADHGAGAVPRTLAE